MRIQFGRWIQEHEIFPERSEKKKKASDTVTSDSKSVTSPSICMDSQTVLNYVFVTWTFGIFYERRLK